MKRLLSLLILSIFLIPNLVFAQTAPNLTAEELAALKAKDNGVQGTDNCPTVPNPNQRDDDQNNTGNACDTEFQKAKRKILSDFASGLIDDKEKANTNLNDILPSPGNCLVDPNNINFNKFSSVCPDNSNEKLDEKFTELKKAFDNRLIVSVLEEPISNENIFTKAQICSTKYLRDRNGFLQFTDKSKGFQDLQWDSLTPIDTQIETLKNQLSNQVNAGGTNKVAIAIDACNTTYVEKCVPRNTFVREANLTDPLPTIVSCSTIQLVFAESGVDLIKQYVGLIYRWATGIVGVLAVLVIMVNGILISTAGGDDGKVSAAKERIIQSLTALAILFFAGIILYSINPNYFTTSNLQPEKETPAPLTPEQIEQGANNQSVS